MKYYYWQDDNKLINMDTKMSVFQISSVMNCIIDIITGFNQRYEEFNYVREYVNKAKYNYRLIDISWVRIDTDESLNDFKIKLEKYFLECNIIVLNKNQVNFL